MQVTAVNAPASTDAPPDSCCSNEHGNFTLEIAPGQAVLVQFAAQHQHEGKILFGPKLPIYCQPKERTDLGKIVYKCMNVIGTVMQANGNAPPTPIANAPLELYTHGNSVAKAIGDALGNFAFERSEPGIYSVSVEADWLASQGLTLHPLPILAFHLGENDQFNHPPICVEQTSFTITGKLMAARADRRRAVCIEEHPGRQITDQCGVFSFKNLPRPAYTIVFPNPATDRHNVSWEIATGESPKSIVTPPKRGRLVNVNAPNYRREVHQVEVLLLHHDGSPASDILVELLTSTGKNSLDRQRTNEAGVARLNSRLPGEFILCPRQERYPLRITRFLPLGRANDHGSCRALRRVPGRSHRISPADGRRVAGGGGFVFPHRRTIARSVTRPVPPSPAFWVGEAKTDDPTGFLAAITNAFELKDVEGRVEWSRLASTSVVSVNADMGAITGAQASILRRAQTTMAEAARILPTIRALRRTPSPSTAHPS